MAGILKETLEEQLEKFSSYSIIANPLMPSQTGTPLDLRQKATEEQRADIIKYNLGYPGLISYDPGNSKFYFCTADNNFKLMNENNFAGVSRSFEEADLIDKANYEILDVNYTVGSELLKIRNMKRYDIPKLPTPHQLLDYDQIYVLAPGDGDEWPQEKYEILIGLTHNETTEKAWAALSNLYFTIGDTRKEISIGNAPDTFIGHQYDGNGNIVCSKIFIKDYTPVFGYKFKCIGVGGCLNYELHKCYNNINRYPESENYYDQMFALFPTENDKKPGYGSVEQAVYQYNDHQYIAALWRGDSLWQIKRPIHDIITTRQTGLITDYAYIVNGTSIDQSEDGGDRNAYTNKGSLILGYKQKNGNWVQDTDNYVYCFTDDESNDNNYLIYSIEGSKINLFTNKILNTIISGDNMSTTNGVMLLENGSRTTLTEDTLKKYIFTIDDKNYYAIRWEENISKLYPVFNTAFDSNNWKKDILNGLYLIDKETGDLTSIEAMQNKIVAQYKRDKTSKWYFIQKDESAQQYKPIWVYNDQMTKDLNINSDQPRPDRHIIYTKIEDEPTRQLAVKELDTDDYNITTKNIGDWKEGDIAKYGYHWYFWTQKNSDKKNNGWKLIQNGYAIYKSENSTYSESTPTFFECSSASLLGILEPTNKNLIIKTASQVKQKNLRFLGEMWVWEEDEEDYKWKQATQSHFIIKNHEFALIESVWTELELRKAFEKLKLDVTEFITVAKDGVSTQSWSKNYLGDQILNILQGDTSSGAFKKKDEIINAFADLGFVSNLPNIKQNSTTQLGIPTAKKALNKKTNDLGQEEESYTPLEVETLNLKRQVNQNNSTWTNEETNKALQSGIYFSHGTDIGQSSLKENNYLLFTENVYTQNSLYDDRSKQVNQVLLGSNVKFRSSLPYISETPEWTEWEEFNWSDVLINNKTNQKSLTLQSTTPIVTETEQGENQFKKITTTPVAAAITIDQDTGICLEYHKPITETITESQNDNEEMVITTTTYTPLKSNLILNNTTFRAEITENYNNQTNSIYDEEGNLISETIIPIAGGATTSWEMTQGEYVVSFNPSIRAHESQLKITDNNFNYTASTLKTKGQLTVNGNGVYAYANETIGTLPQLYLWESFIDLKPQSIAFVHQKRKHLLETDPTPVQELEFTKDSFTLNGSPILTQANFTEIMGEIGSGGSIDTSNLVSKFIPHPQSTTGETVINHNGEFIELLAEIPQGDEYAGIKIDSRSVTLWGFSKEHKLCIDDEGLTWKGQPILPSGQFVCEESELQDYKGFIENKDGEITLFHMNPANTHEIKTDDTGIQLNAYSAKQLETTLKVNENGVEINKLNIGSRLDIVNDETIYGFLDWGNIGDEWGLYIKEQFALVDFNDDFPYMSTQRWKLLFGSLSDSESSPAPIKFNLHSDNPSIYIKGLAIQNDNGSLMVGGDTVMTDTTFHEQTADFAKIIDLTNATIINMGGAE